MKCWGWLWNGVTGCALLLLWFCCCSGWKVQYKWLISLHMCCIGGWVWVSTDGCGSGCDSDVWEMWVVNVIFANWRRKKYYFAKLGLFLFRIYFEFNWQSVKWIETNLLLVIFNIYCTYIQRQRLKLKLINYIGMSRVFLTHVQYIMHLLIDVEMPGY